MLVKLVLFRLVEYQLLWVLLQTQNVKKQITLSWTSDCSVLRNKETRRPYDQYCILLLSQPSTKWLWSDKKECEAEECTTEQEDLNFQAELQRKSQISDRPKKQQQQKKKIDKRAHTLDRGRGEQSWRLTMSSLHSSQALDLLIAQ